mgnify:FL=1|jgi:hypothetical protein
MEYHYQIGKSKVTIISNTSPEEKKRNLKNIYDTVNRIADNQRLAGNNSVDDWFYTQKELEELKKNNSPRLIY